MQNTPIRPKFAPATFFKHLGLAILLMVSVSACLPEAEEEPDIFEEFFKDLREIRTYIATNNIQGIDSTSTSGLMYRVISVGDSNKYAVERALVKFEYTARTLDEIEFLDSYDQEGNLGALLGTSILLKALEEGLYTVGEGGKVEVFAPSVLAYSRAGLPPHVDPFEPVIFTIEIIDILNPPNPAKR